MAKARFTKDELMEAVMSEGRVALLNAAKEAATRGDIGKEGCVEVWDWLRYWADRNYPVKDPDGVD